MIYNIIILIITIFAIMIRIQPFSMSHNRRSKCPPLFITYHGTIPMPTNSQTTPGIHRRNSACGRRAPLKSRCAGGVELFPCCLLVQRYYNRQFTKDTLIGITYKIGFLCSSSYTIRAPIESNHPK